MDAAARRKEILSFLKNEKKPVSASRIAAHFSVSRQIIVGDIALLRASGASITATPRGYLIPRDGKRLIHRVACCHSGQENMRKELYAMVDEGCTVLDVIVEHPLYGELTGSLRLASRHDVDEFVLRSSEYQAQPLSLLTNGIHLHTLSCPDEAAYQRVRKKLDALGFLVTRSDAETSSES